MGQLYGVEEIPFSKNGSALTIQKRKQVCHDGEIDCGYYLRALYEDDRDRLLFRLSFDGSMSEIEETRKPHKLTLRKGTQSIAICFSATDTIRFSGICQRFELYMSPKEIIKYNAAMYYDSRHVGVNTYTRKGIVYALKGEISLDAPWGENESNTYIRIVVHPNESGEMDFVYKEFRTEFTRDYLTSTFEEDCLSVLEDYHSFCKRIGDCVVPELSDVFSKARFILWNNQQEPNQLIKRHIILSGKQKLCEIRHVDSLLIMLAMMKADPSLAWNQYVLFSDSQDDSGAMPSWIGSYKINNRWVNPPIEGMIVAEFLRQDVLNRSQMETIFDSLSRQVEFWLLYRETDGDGLVEYFHPKDCGLEEYSPFVGNMRTPSLELNTWLILSVDCLERISEELNRPAQTKYWRDKRENLLTAFLPAVSKVICRDVPNIEKRGMALPICLDYVPIALGELLPLEISSKLVKNLMSSGLQYNRENLEKTSVNSILCAAWVISIALGLLRLGKVEEAEDWIFAYCHLVSDKGFYAVHREGDWVGMGDSAFSATAAVVLYMLRDFVEGVE